MQNFALGSLAPRGTRRVVYNSDPSNTTRHLSEPAKPEELRQVVRNYAAKGAIDTLVQEIWHQGWSEFWRTDSTSTALNSTTPGSQRVFPGVKLRAA